MNSSNNILVVRTGPDSTEDLILDASISIMYGVDKPVYIFKNITLLSGVKKDYHPQLAIKILELYSIIPNEIAISLRKRSDLMRPSYEVLKFSLY